ncbi:hypothetical protein DXG03_001490 [Asterophora parasitica]|uniref:Polysaccharide lyase 14 domain-containing protein n=1 Tax=Asterophora parasitica TaxID=117018 RepID=A0A9P7G5H1_9AGAR|nr:hypothetical protein DXG03_001490 [Asterophora parasitica]
MLHLNSVLYFVLATAPIYVASQQTPVEQIASLYGLTTSTTFPFPSATATSSDAETLLVNQWSLGRGRLQDGPENLAFVADPFPNAPVPGSPANTSPAGPVLQVTYNANTFGSVDSGAQFYNLWNATGGSTFQSMIASYELAFDEGFDWVKGGKLPGLRGGLNSSGCSGGHESDGRDCFSTRLMWRKNGAGEVYAYIPTPNNLCSTEGITCNPDYGISVQRGAFGFTSGQWNRVTILVRLNNPPNVANGNVQLYFNGVKAIDQQNLQIRSASSVSANGFYFSTFFGGSDNTWETPKTVHTYFRNIQLYAGSAPSNLTGSKVSAASRSATLGLGSQILSVVLGGAIAALFI